MVTMFSRNTVIVNAVICTLSLVGGAGIITGYFVSNGASKMRQRVVLGLGVCDFIQALTVLTGSALNLQGTRFPTNSPGCNASGFLYQLCAFVSAGFTLAIAVVTYTTLVHPMSRVSAFMEGPKAIYCIWAGVWLAGAIPAIFGTVFLAMIDQGGLCWYQAGSIQSKLMIFIPRAVALIGVIGLYTKLFMFFRGRDMAFMNTTSAEEEDPISDRRISLQRVSTKLQGWGRRVSEVGQSSFGVASFTNNGTASQDPSPAHPLSPSPPSGEDHSRNTTVVITLPQTRLHANHTHTHRDDEDDDGADSTPSTSEFPDLPTFPNPKHPGIGMKRNSSGGLTDDRTEAMRRMSQAQTPAIPKRKRPLSPRQINKRLSFLMMLYPLAYLLLFSVSVGRLIVQLSTDKPVHPMLTNISRWLVFGQGAVDGLLYFLIEWLFKRSTRGRT